LNDSLGGDGLQKPSDKLAINDADIPVEEGGFDDDDFA
jgi:hypothetical protein